MKKASPRFATASEIIVSRYGKYSHALGRIPVNRSPEVFDRLLTILDRRPCRQSDRIARASVLRDIRQAVGDLANPNWRSGRECVEQWLDSSKLSPVVSFEIQDQVLPALLIREDHDAFMEKSRAFVDDFLYRAVWWFFRRYSSDVRDALRSLKKEWASYKLGPILLRDVTRELGPGNPPNVEKARQWVEAWLAALPPLWERNVIDDPKDAVASVVSMVLLPLLRLFECPERAINTDPYLSQTLVSPPPSKRPPLPKGFRYRCECGSRDDARHAKECWVTKHDVEEMERYRSALPAALLRTFRIWGRWAFLHHGTAAAFEFAEPDLRERLLRSVILNQQIDDDRPLSRFGPEADGLTPILRFIDWLEVFGSLRRLGRKMEKTEATRRLATKCRVSVRTVGTWRKAGEIGLREWMTSSSSQSSLSPNEVNDLIKRPEKAIPATFRYLREDVEYGIREEKARKLAGD
jgi:hypothetical protein